VAEHVRDDSQRLDHIAAMYIGDPEAFWMICDINNAVDPAELTRLAGERLLIGLPEGVPGGRPAL
jgi:hypothetical protein